MGVKWLYSRKAIGDRVRVGGRARVGRGGGPGEEGGDGKSQGCWWDVTKFCGRMGGERTDQRR